MFWTIIFGSFELGTMSATTRWYSKPSQRHIRKLEQGATKNHWAEWLPSAGWM